MNVWIINDFSHGEISVYSEDTDVAEIPYVKDELGYLEGHYDDEREQFIKDVARAQAKGHGRAAIEERFSAELVTVETH